MQGEYVGKILQQGQDTLFFYLEAFGFTCEVKLSEDKTEYQFQYESCG
jgi:hypothetical protein